MVYLLFLYICTVLFTWSVVQLCCNSSMKHACTYVQCMRSLMGPIPIMAASDYVEVCYTLFISRTLFISNLQSFSHLFHFI